MLVVPQHRTGQGSLVGNDTIMSTTVIELSPSWTGTDFTPFHGRDRRGRRSDRQAYARADDSLAQGARGQDLRPQ
ncbi:hypothetical protein [Rhodococcus opacus]|uniref:Uncharacterized protein n=1 Tax=Rhodococcus opacus TaxID=37919 RepID=A0A076F3W8_RHOOP|nr:hypothetical protein [Rhodococcus opacus]AII10489.1 hypothetical protein EP51_40145 [Rhodococcus opacus]